MLKAILHGKAGRLYESSHGERVSWRKLFQLREDLLTAAIFSRWAYLSSKTQNILMRQWFGVNADCEFDFSTLVDIHFWPQYDLSEVDGRSFVEPDVLIQFDDFDVLIEVKPPLGGDQYLEQWRSEIAGYFNSNENEGKPLLFLAVGRLDKVPEIWREAIMKVDDGREPVIINAIKWKSVAESIFYLIDGGGLSMQDNRVLADMLTALELYGVRGHDYKWKDFSANVLPKISLDQIARFAAPEFDGEEGVELGSDVRRFVEMKQGFRALNMESMTVWPI